MKAIRDRHGAVVAWLDGDTLREQGIARAFISGGGVFTFRGRYLGEHQDGWFRDRRGRAVAFLETAFGLPKRPDVTGRPPSPPASLPVPPRPAPPAATAPAPAMPTWSAISWSEYMAQ